MNVEIRVERIRNVEGKGNLKAFVDLRIGKTLFRSWRIIQQPGQRPWVSPPVESWETKEGERRYRRLVVLPEELQKRVEEEVLRAWQGREDRSQWDDEIPF
jgi:DNA-binding cell septation regulator SpoVG